MFNKWETHELKGSLGVYEIDEFRDFYIVKKKLQYPSQKGFYDPIALVIAKRDKKLPFFPDKDFSNIFGTTSPFFPIHIGVKGDKNEFLKHMRKSVKDNKINISELWSASTLNIQFSEVVKPLREIRVDFGDNKLATWLERKLFGRKITIKNK